MVQTIEAFVNRLQADGVEAGREAAEKIRCEAEQTAQRTLEEARQQARVLLEEARADGEKIRARTDAELKLAARDTLVRLEDAVRRALRGVLFHPVRERLGDDDFLADLIRETVLCYAQADAAGGSTITVNVSAESRQRLAGRVLAAFRPDAPQSAALDLQGTLAEAGFEYRIGDGTVEVTTESIVDVLAEIVGPELRKLLVQAGS
jgi:hypothetical protein